MIETLILFALGSVIASLLPMVVVPFVHRRAERLTIFRIEASGRYPLRIHKD
jgi:hypothetical protein